MKKFYRYILTVAAALLSMGTAAQAQIGTPLYHFQSRQQVEAATRANLRNLRNSYNIITCASRQGMIRSVLKVYEKEMDKGVYAMSPEVCSSLAFAHTQTIMQLNWDWKPDHTLGITHIKQGDALKIAYIRDQALSAMPDSPEVLLCYAIYLANQTSGNRPRALAMVEKACQLAPNWADAHYFHQYLLNLRAVVYPEAQWTKVWPSYGTAMIKAMDRAVQLDPGIARVSPDRMYAYSYMKQPRLALAAFDNFSKLRPDFEVRMDQMNGAGYYDQLRNGLVKQANRVAQASENKKPVAG